MKKENVVKSVFVLAIGVISPLIFWLLLKNLADNSSSAHNPDPYLQTLVDKPQVFKRNAAENSWYKIVSKEGEMYWEKELGVLAPLAEIPTLQEHTIFLIDAQGPKAAYLFYEFLKSRDYLKKALLLSPSDGLLKDLQFHDGNLQLSCGQAYLIRLRMLNQLGIANLMKTNMSAAYLDDSLFENDKKAFIELFKLRRVPIFMLQKPGTTPTTDVNILAI